MSRRTSRTEMKDTLLQTDPTRDYVSTRFSYFGELFVQKLPIWRLWTGRMMLTSDPLVNFALGIRDAAISVADIEIVCDNPRVAQWLQEQWSFLWNNYRSKLMSAKRFGFAPLQLTFKQKNGMICIKSVKDFAPEDVRCLEVSNRIAGLRVKGKAVYSPQSLWLTYGSEYGSTYGTGVLRKQYPAWYEKWMDHGAKRLLQLRMIKDAYIGDIFWYPPNMVMTLPDGTKVSIRDIMRELGENRLSGGVMSLPMMYDNQGKELTKYTPPQALDGASQIFDWVNHCDEGMLHGAGIPPEVVKAAETGSGYSGRSIPFMVLLSGCTQELVETIQCIDQQCFRPLVWLNAGSDVEYQIYPRSLVESFAADSSGSAMGGSALGSQAGAAPSPQPMPGGQSAVQFGEPGGIEHGGGGTLHSPPRGVAIHGVHYKPGQPIPHEVIHELTPEDKAKLRAGSIARHIQANPQLSQELSSHGNTQQSGPSHVSAGSTQAGAVQGFGGVHGSSGLMEPSGSSASQHAPPLIGLPTNVKIPGGSDVTAGPHHGIREVAAAYMAHHGLEHNPPKSYVKVNPERAKRIADEYHNATHNPHDPETKAAYAAFSQETLAQYQFAKNHGKLNAEFIQEHAADPYAQSPRLATEDVHKNNHLWVFPTASGFGTEPANTEHHPLLADSGEKISGRPATINDIFRIVHDYYGHAKEGVGFRADGEENAWRAHAAMYSPAARRAMTTETRGQNSWVNYGPHTSNKTAKADETIFAPQKTTLLPEWVSEEGRHDPDSQHREFQFDEKKPPHLMTKHEFEAHAPVNSLDDVEHGKPVTIHALYKHSDHYGYKRDVNLGKQHIPHGFPPNFNLHDSSAKHANKLIAADAHEEQGNHEAAHDLRDAAHNESFFTDVKDHGQHKVKVTLHNPHVIPYGYRDTFRDLSPSKLQAAGHDGVVVQGGKDGLYGKGYRMGVAFHPHAVTELHSDESKAKFSKLQIGAKVIHKQTGETGKVQQVRHFGHEHDAWRKANNQPHSTGYASVRWNGSKKLGTVARNDHNVAHEHVMVHNGHEHHIQQAMKRGDHVPPHVLADYPHLQHPENPTQHDEEPPVEVHKQFHGLSIAVECKAGERRKPGYEPLANDYGRIERTEGADGDAIDVFLGPELDSEIVFVFDQPKVSQHTEDVKPSWWHEQSENRFAQMYKPGMTKGEEIEDHFERHNWKPDADGLHTFYHGSPNKYKTLRAGSLLATTPHSAAHYAARDRELDPADTHIHTVKVKSHQVHVGIFPSLRDDHPAHSIKKFGG